MISATQDKPAQQVSAQLSRPAPVEPAQPKPRAFRNIIWNWAGILAEASVAFVLTPFLIGALGDDVYGLWVLIGAFTGYFGMLDLGMRGAVGRFVAMHLAKGDQRGVNTILSTAMAMLIGVGIASFAAIACCTPLLQLIFDIPDLQLPSVRLALLIVGFQLALWFVLRIFDAALWARQRFDVLNSIDIPLAIARAFFTWHLVSAQGGLVALASISVASIILNGILKCVFTFREMPEVRIRWQYVCISSLREMTSYGIWNSLVSFMTMARSQGLPVVIGAAVGMRYLSPFSVIMRLPSLASTILIGATGVFTPIAVRHHATGDHAARTRLVLQGTRLSFSLALYFAILFLFLGKPLLAVWIRPDFAAYGSILAIIGCGEILPMAMSIPLGVLQAMARHQRMAKYVMLETALVLIGSILLGSVLGLMGVAIVVALSAAAFRGVVVLYQICDITDITVREFVRKTMAAPLAVALGSSVLLVAANECHPPSGWVALVAYGAAFSAIYALGVCCGVLTQHHRRRLWSEAFRWSTRLVG